MTAVSKPQPFPQRGLQPFLSSATLQAHYHQHHKAHLEYLERAVKGTDLATLSLQDIVLSTEGEIFHHAAEVWNHNFFWRCLAPSGTTSLAGALLRSIESTFSSAAQFKHEFETSALNKPGSGWTWLIKKSDGALSILSTDDSLTPLLDSNSTPLLTIDTWEHAYYHDYQGDKAAYLANFWSCVNWSFAQQNYHR